MAGALGHNVALDAAPGESEIADQVKDFMAHILVRKAQRTVLRPFCTENDDALRSGAADEAHVA